MANDNSQGRTRGETSVLIAVVMLGFLGLNYGMTRTTETAEHRDRAMTAHVQERQCVVADTKGRFPSMYRCELPVAHEYVDAGVLAAEAMAHHP